MDINKNFLSTKQLLTFMRNKFGKEVSYGGKKRETKALGFFIHDDKARQRKGDPAARKEYVYVKESTGEKENSSFRIVIYPFCEEIQKRLNQLPAVNERLISFQNSKYGLKTVKSTGYIMFKPKISNTQFGIEVAIYDIKGLEQLISFITYELDEHSTNQQAPYPPKKTPAIKEN
ncbi:hypothetical protein [Xenorhabdus bovienii]|uniref:hypothetical protein n=1 Tax=Xenorhabdus bovienii TaxID=40576 RepID=UPI0023B241CA|nr:hypothetical protein [Xenorhabdus bovienii]MDE9454592.1 hypothetical protein [Xenorhabdus bovienii]